MTTSRIIYLATLALLAVVTALSVVIYRSTERDAIEGYSSQQLAVTRAVATAIEAEIDALSRRLQQFNSLPSVQSPDLSFTGQRVQAAFGSDDKGIIVEVARVDRTGRVFRWTIAGEITLDTVSAVQDRELWAQAATPAQGGQVTLESPWWTTGAPAHHRALVMPVWRTAASTENPVPPNDFNGILAIVIDVRRLAEIYLGAAAADLAEDEQVLELGDTGPAVRVSAAGLQVTPGVDRRPAVSAPQGSAIANLPDGRRVHAWSSLAAADQTWSVETSARYSRVTARVRRSAIGQLALTTTLLLGLSLAAWLLIRRERRAERDQQALELQLVQAQKMDAIGKLAGGVAHDFNNLLTAILGYTGMLVDDTTLGSSAHQHAQQIRRAAESAAGMTQKLLAFSRRQVLQTEPLDLGQWLTQLLPLLARLIGERVTLTSSFEPDLWLVNADPVQVEQSVINLAVNARDAMPAGGTLHLSLGNLARPQGERRKGFAVRPGDYVQMRVADTGAGMSEATLRRMFEPFFTTKPLGEGTGLGLSSVYGFVRQSGGYIDVTSKPGEGTTFELLLPRSLEIRAPQGIPAPPPAAVVTSALARARVGGETVLVVEDESAVRALVKASLQRQGYRVLAAASGDEAVRMVKETSEPIDVLLTDVVMPGMQGPQLATVLRQQHPSLPVVFMSGYAADVVTEEMLETATLLQKPFSSQVMLSAIREAIDEDRRT